MDSSDNLVVPKSRLNSEPLPRAPIPVAGMRLNRLSFSTPLKTPCQKRKERKQVLFASGFGGIKVKFAKWKKSSLERC